MKPLNYIRIIIILFLFLFFALPTNAYDCGWNCWDKEGKVFTYENVDHPDRITTITVTQATETYWRVMFEKNHPETYRGSWNKNKYCHLDWWGMSNNSGVYVKGGNIFNFDYDFISRIEYFANQNKKIICNNGHPAYLLIPPEPFEVPFCLIQKYSLLRKNEHGEEVWYDYNWIAHYNWETILVRSEILKEENLGEEVYVVALKLDFFESKRGKNLINEIWWFVKDVGIVQIESKRWKNNTAGQSDKIRLIDIQ